jgi:hypothetical protein
VAATPNPKIRNFVKKLVGITLMLALGILLLGYAIDYLIFRYRVSANRQPFSLVTVTSFDAVAQKNGRTEFIFNPPQPQTCSNSIFPQAGYTPCWYLRSHTERRTNI